MRAESGRQKLPPSEKLPRLRVGRLPVSGDFVVDELDGPRKLALRDESGEVMRFATHEAAQAQLETSRAFLRSGTMGSCPTAKISSSAKK